MGFFLTVEPAEGCWGVTLGIALSRQETTDLFFSGDVMVSWPEDGLADSTGQPLERTGLFVSEVVARGGVLHITYGQQQQAERAAALIGAQLRATGLSACSAPPEG